MKRIILILAILGSAAYAQQQPTPPLKTSDVGVDKNGVCWIRGPANVLTMCGPTGAAMTVTAATILPTAGYWLVVSTAGVPTIVSADGTTTAAGAIGKAYPVATP
jgi:hypothetical protein